MHNHKFRVAYAGPKPTHKRPFPNDISNDELDDVFRELRGQLSKTIQDPDATVEVDFAKPYVKVREVIVLTSLPEATVAAIVVEAADSYGLDVL